MRIKDLLKVEAIELGVSAANKEAAIDKLVALHDKVGNLADVEGYKAAILKRESESTTAIGEGLAVPHAKTAAAKHPGLAAITVPDGVDYDAPDGQPATLLFMIAAPEGAGDAGDAHLEILSRLMVMLMDPDFGAALRAAKTPEEFLDIINKQEAAKYPEEEPKEAPKKKEIKGNPVIYKIGNKEIRRDEILEEVKLLPPQLVSQTPADKLFDIMKRQKLMSYLVVEQAKKAGMDKEKEYIDQINKLKERVLFENYLVKELEPKASNKTTLQKHYQDYLVEFKSGKEIKISTIALSTEKEAKEVISALGKGAAFDKLQKEKGLASSENSDRYIPVLRMPDELKKKFNAVAKNEVTKEPIKIADTYHVIKIVDMRDSKPSKFDEIKPLLSQIILREEMDKLLTKLENQYKVQKFNEDGTPEVVGQKK